VHRRALLELLERYAASHPAEVEVATRVRELAELHPNCFERDCMPGHITASAWIVSHDHGHFLLTHHRKLDRWLQLGGHADGDPDVLAVALREAREESGLRQLEPVLAGGELLPFDLDVHEIPAWGDDPAHEHHDLRFLLRAAAGQSLVMSEESKDLRWFESGGSGVEALLGEESLLRLYRKARVLLDSA
jgi:8-oxo-dGTP pyrophosphatase MutT (NUDIX family)